MRMQIQSCLRMTRHGFPTAIESEGMSWTTTLPAPMMQRSPIVTPGQTVTPPPSQQSSPMVIAYVLVMPCADDILVVLFPQLFCILMGFIVSPFRFTATWCWCKDCKKNDDVSEYFHDYQFTTFNLSKAWTSSALLRLSRLFCDRTNGLTISAFFLHCFSTIYVAESEVVCCLTFS